MILELDYLDYYDQEYILLCCFHLLINLILSIFKYKIFKSTIKSTLKVILKLICWFDYGFLDALLLCLLISVVLNVRPHCSHSTISLFTALVFTCMLLLACNLLFFFFLIVWIVTRHSSVVASVMIGVFLLVSISFH